MLHINKQNNNNNNNTEPIRRLRSDQKNNNYRWHVGLKNVNGKVQKRSKGASLYIRESRESLRQGFERKAVVLYEKIRNGEKICRLSQDMYKGSETVVVVCFYSHPKETINNN